MGAMTESAFTNMERRRPALVAGLLFFLLIPALIGVLLGANRAGVALFFPWPVGILFWSLTTVGVWFLLYLGAALSGVLLRPWNPPLWLILLSGAVIGSFPARYLMYYSVETLSGFLLDGREPQPVPAVTLSWEFLGYYLRAWFGVFALWTAVGLFFDRWFGFPRFGRNEARGECERERKDGAVSASGTPTAGHPAAVPNAPPLSPEAVGGATPDAEPDPAPQIAGGLAERLPEKLGGNILALKAEDHYVRVYTDRGSDLVLYRLSDAITELAALDGVRVHRSYWVRKSSVRGVQRHGRGLLLTLSNDLEVPVSQTYKELAREAGLTPEKA